MSTHTTVISTQPLVDMVMTISNMLPQATTSKATARKPTVATVNNRHISPSSTSSRSTSHRLISNLSMCSSQCSSTSSQPTSRLPPTSQLKVTRPMLPLSSSSPRTSTLPLVTANRRTDELSFEQLSPDTHRMQFKQQLVTLESTRPIIKSELLLYVKLV